MNAFFHSVALEKEKCIGCTTCIKRCPTEAIRVRNSKAKIDASRCIDCGECIRVCPKNAKRAHSTRMSALKHWKYKVAIPAPALFGQFNNLNDIDIVLNGLKKIGFDEVYEVSRGAEVVSDVTQILFAQDKLKKPVISSACPAVVRLIRQRFPSLIDNVLPLKAPMEVTARMAKKEFSAKLGVPMDEVGVFFITPCPAKVTDFAAPIGSASSWVDGAISIAKIFPRLSEAMDKEVDLNNLERIARSGMTGVNWATSGGEAKASFEDRYLAADGIENVINVLEQIEDERIQDVDFIELNACSGGCVGGVLCVENPYIAKTRIHRLHKYLPEKQNRYNTSMDSIIKWTQELEYTPVMKLSEDINEAFTMMSDIEELRKKLPEIDCGSCGSPTCKAFAEDVVKGKVKETDCVFILRQKIKNAADALSQIGAYDESE